MAQWLIETATGRFLTGGAAEPIVADPSTQAIVTLEGPSPDPTRDRYDERAPWGIRPATEAELQADSLSAADAQADIEAKRKDYISLLGTTLKRFDPTWATMTNAQKKAALKSMSDDYAQIRRFVERNL